MWSSASALLLFHNCQWYEVQLPHFRSARTFKVLKLSFRNYALSLLPKSEFSLSILPVGQGFDDLVHVPHLFCQDFLIWLSPLRISSLPGLPKMWSPASTLLLCLDCQSSEVPLFVPARPGLRKKSRSSSALVLQRLPNMDKFTSAFHLCRDFQRSEVPLLHFCFALTAKDVKFCFLSSAVRSYYAFPHKFILSIEGRVR